MQARLHQQTRSSKRFRVHTMSEKEKGTPVIDILLSQVNSPFRQKCDGATICNVCQVIGKETQCVYKDFQKKGVVLSARDQDKAELAPRAITVTSRATSQWSDSGAVTHALSRTAIHVSPQSFNSQISDNSLDDLCLAL